MATITSPRAASPSSITPRIKSPSLIETPTSSVRGSFELPSRNPSVSSASTPNPGQTQTQGQGQAQPRRNRAALRDYYNLKSKPQVQTGRPGGLSRTASITSATSEVSTAASVNTLTEDQKGNDTTSSLTAQLDTQDFDAEGYISELLATSGLRDILRVEGTLVSEIRNLDGERKALVYDNYSKLILAVGTMGEMQRSMNAAGGGLSEVGELEGRMDKLGGMAMSLGRVGQGDVRLREARKERREEAGRQKGRTVLVQRVLAAPGNLKMLLDAGKDDEAEKEWEFVRARLDTWKGVKGVEEVRAQCEAVMTTSSDEDDSEYQNESKPGH